MNDLFGFVITECTKRLDKEVYKHSIVPVSFSPPDAKYKYNDLSLFYFCDQLHSLHVRLKYRGRNMYLSEEEINPTLKEIPSHVTEKIGREFMAMFLLELEDRMKLTKSFANIDKRLSERFEYFGPDREEKILKVFVIVVLVRFNLMIDSIVETVANTGAATVANILKRIDKNEDIEDTIKSYLENKHSAVRVWIINKLIDTPETAPTMKKIMLARRISIC